MIQDVIQYLDDDEDEEGIIVLDCCFSELAL
jgi:hypothetical protein